MLLHLKNPHSIFAVLETRPQDVLELVVPPPKGSSQREDLGQNEDIWRQIVKKAQNEGIRVSSREGSSREKRRGEPLRSGGRSFPMSDAEEKDSRIGVGSAKVQERMGVSVEELFAAAPERAGGKGLWIALDSLQDPQNVGAIFRSAAFFGVQGILMTQDRSAPLSATVYDVASGGLEYVPFTILPNLQNAFRVAKDAGLWILGTSEHAQGDFRSIGADRPWLLVLGNEERGMRRLTQENCDVLCKISSGGKVSSLNVSVSAGVFISHLTRVS